MSPNGASASRGPIPAVCGRNSERRAPPCSPASSCAPRHPRHARSLRSLRVAPGCSGAPLDPGCAAAAFRTCRDEGRPAPRSAREVRLALRAASNQGQEGRCAPARLPRPAKPDVNDFSQSLQRRTRPSTRSIRTFSGHLAISDSNYCAAGRRTRFALASTAQEGRSEPKTRIQIFRFVSP